MFSRMCWELLVFSGNKHEKAQYYSRNLASRPLYSRSLGASYTSRRLLALGRDALEALTGSFPSSQEARELVEIESRG